MKRTIFTGILILISALALAAVRSPAVAAPTVQTAAEGQLLFQQKCAACHTIGGGVLVGPDLKGVVVRRDLNWLQGFIAAPDRMIASGDQLALQLLAESNNVPMPNLALSDAEVSALITYLETAEGSAQPANPAPALPAGDPAAGRQLFNGEIPLSAGGPACIACHSIQGTGLLEGGSLGPDLTQVAQRFGEAGLAANLNQFTFPTMIGPFRNRPLSPQEQADLLAYFIETSSRPPAAVGAIRNLLLGIGMGAAFLLFGMMFVFRPRRESSVVERLRRRRR